MSTLSSSKSIEFKIMNWEELRKEAYKLPVYERLLLVNSIISSLTEELRPRPPQGEGGLTQLTGLLKTEASPPTDEEIKTILEEHREEKYLK